MYFVCTVDSISLEQSSCFVDFVCVHDVVRSAPFVFRTHIRVEDVSIVLGFIAVIRHILRSTVRISFLS